MKTWTCPLCGAHPMPFDLLTYKRKPRWYCVVRCQACGAKMGLGKGGILWLADRAGRRMTTPDGSTGAAFSSSSPSSMADDVPF